MQEQGAQRETRRVGRGRGGGAVVVVAALVAVVVAEVEDDMGRADASIVALGVDTGAKHDGISDSGMGMGSDMRPG